MKQIKQTSLGTIARAATLVMAFFILSRILGVVRDAVIAAQFGTSAAYEAYLAAFRLPDFMFYVIAGGALGSAFIPTYTAYLVQDDTAAAQRLAAAILNWLLIILTTASLLAALFAPFLVDRAIAPGFTPEQKLLTVELMRWLLASTVIFGVSGLAMAILHSHQHFLLPALAPVVYNLAIIAGAWLLGPTLGVRGLVVGVVVGAAGHLFVQAPGLRQVEWRYQWRLSLTDPGVREVARLMGPRVLGLAAIQLNFIWDTFLASGLPVGSLAGLNFAWRVMLLPQGIIGQAVGAAAFPTLAGLANREAWSEMQEALVGILRGILYLGIPAAVGLLVLGEPIVRLLFERQDFDARSTALTVWALGFFSLGLVAHALVEVLTRVFYALHNTRTPVTLALAAMAVNIGLSWLLMQLFGRVGLAPHGGIALASSIAVSLETVWLVRALRHLPGRLSLAGLGGPASRMVFAGVWMGLVLWGWLHFAAGWSPWLSAPLGIGLGGLVYGLTTLGLGLPEPRLFLAQLRRRLRR